MGELRQQYEQEAAALAAQIVEVQQRQQALAEELARLVTRRVQVAGALEALARAEQ